MTDIVTGQSDKPMTALPGFVELMAAEWEALKRLWLIVGSPMMGKSTSLLTAPRPMVVVSSPLEMGHATLPPSTSDVRTLVYPLDLSRDVSWGTVITNVKGAMTRIFAGELGKFKTLSVDGLHKLHKAWQYACDSRIPQGVAPDWLKLSGQVNEPFFMELKRWQRAVVNGNPAGIQNLICTAWLAPDKDNPNVTKMNEVTVHEYPALPGKAGRDIVGEFAVVVKADRQGDGPAAQYVWRTKPDTMVWGVGIKAPQDIASKIPAVLPQRWGELARHLGVTP